MTAAWDPAQWLESIVGQGNGVGVHAHLLTTYRLRREENFLLLGAEDVEAMRAQFLAAGMPHLYVNAICRAMHKKRQPGDTILGPTQVTLSTLGTDSSDTVLKTPSTTEKRKRHLSVLQADDSRGNGAGKEDSVITDVEEDDDEEDMESEDDEDYVNDGDEEDEEPAVVAKKRRKPTTRRARARKGQAARDKAATSEAEGRAHLKSMYGRSSSSTNWYGLGGRSSVDAAASGRAAPFVPLLKRDPLSFCSVVCGPATGMTVPSMINGRTCVCPPDAAQKCCGDATCAVQLSKIVAGAVVALRTPQEKINTGINTKYNLARLRSYLLQHAFGPTGNYLVHMFCLRAMFNVGCDFLARCHKIAIATAGAPTEIITKTVFVQRKLTREEVIVPDECETSVQHYLDSLQADDKLTVMSRPPSHGLTGRPGNRAKTEERRLFRMFVQHNRTPTGRTRDSDGRFHGAEFHLAAHFKKLIIQNGRNNNLSEIFQHAFNIHLEQWYIFVCLSSSRADMHVCLFASPHTRARACAHACNTHAHACLPAIAVIRRGIVSLAGTKNTTRASRPPVQQHS